MPSDGYQGDSGSLPHRRLQLPAELLLLLLLLLLLRAAVHSHAACTTASGSAASTRSSSSATADAAAGPQRGGCSDDSSDTATSNWDSCCRCCRACPVLFLPSASRPLASASCAAASRSGREGTPGNPLRWPDRVDKRAKPQPSPPLVAAAEEPATAAAAKLCTRAVTACFGTCCSCAATQATARSLPAARSCGGLRQAGPVAAMALAILKHQAPSQAAVGTCPRPSRDAHRASLSAAPTDLGLFRAGSRAASTASSRPHGTSAPAAAAAPRQLTSRANCGAGTVLRLSSIAWANRGSPLPLFSVPCAGAAAACTSSCTPWRDKPDTLHTACCITAGTSSSGSTHSAAATSLPALLEPRKSTKRCLLLCRCAALASRSCSAACPLR
mmetsp:Transcript_22428/g.48990  ORF Transcript_22428/g.48990 Transcript_22428/m.48990 type:complete len:386 (-) Transcript_22428:2662-3819(-)